MFILSSISRGLEVWSVNHTSIYENFDSKCFKNIKFLDGIFNNWPNTLLGTNLYKALELCWQLLLATLKCVNSTSVISNKAHFHHFHLLLSYF